MQTIKVFKNAQVLDVIVAKRIQTLNILIMYF